MDQKMIAKIGATLIHRHETGYINDREYLLGLVYLAYVNEQLEQSKEANVNEYVGNRKN